MSPLALARRGFWFSLASELAVDVVAEMEVEAAVGVPGGARLCDGGVGCFGASGVELSVSSAGEVFEGFSAVVELAFDGGDVFGLFAEALVGEGAVLHGGFEVDVLDVS